MEAMILADIEDDETLHNDKEHVDGLTWTTCVEYNDADKSESEDDDDDDDDEKGQDSGALLECVRSAALTLPSCAGFFA